MGQQRWRWMMAGGLIAAIILLLLFQIHDIRSKAVLLERHTAELNIRMRVLNHEIIGFSDPHAKEVCVSHWDADLDGELSYQEAAAVTSLGDVFTKDSVLRSFSELAYFTGLEDISPCAFWDCTRLETVTEFSDPVVKSICIRHWDRDGDKELSIDEAMAVTSLGAAFSGNASIRSFDELKYFTGLTEIDASAFDRCTNLRSVRLPSSLKSIGHNAFLACSLRSVYIPSGVTSIAPTAFGSCWYLSRVEISSDNPVYDSRENCNAIIETRTNKMITGSVTAFIPRSVTSLSDECFNWFNRDELILPAQISHLGPWSLTSIFHRVYCESPIPPTFDSQDGAAYLFPHSDMGFTEPTNIYVPYGSLEAYRKAEGWALFADRLREYPALAMPYSLSFFPLLAKKNQFEPI
ncbi:MAG: leucine-rich repeat domain-containing protein [Prevotella sp.]|nr:leucine-rich repeat domain-containing protein [Prevotella sp.]